MQDWHSFNAVKTQISGWWIHYFYSMINLLNVSYVTVFAQIVQELNSRFPLLFLNWQNISENNGSWIYPWRVLWQQLGKKTFWGGWVDLNNSFSQNKNKQRGKKIQIYKNFELFWMKNCCLRYEEFEMLPKSKMFRSLSISALFLLWSQRSLNISKCSPYVWLHHWPLPPPLVFGVTRVCVHRRPLSLQQKNPRAVGGSTIDSDQGKPAVLSATWMHEKILCSLCPVCGENKPCSQML